MSKRPIPSSLQFGTPPKRIKEDLFVNKARDHSVISKVPSHSKRDKTDRDTMAIKTTRHKTNEVPSTPLRTSASNRSAGNLNTTRDIIQGLLAPELNGRRLACRDLVEDSFGHIVPTRLAKYLLKALFERGLLKVRRIKQQRADEDVSQLYEAACEEAEKLTTDARAEGGSHNNASFFEWSWTTGDCKTKEQGANFLNTVAVTCIASLAFGDHEDFEYLEERLKHSFRFQRSPYAKYKLPLPDHLEDQDLQPNINHFPQYAYKTNVDTTRPTDFLDCSMQVRQCYQYLDSRELSTLSDPPKSSATPPLCTLPEQFPFLSSMEPLLSQHNTSTDNRQGNTMTNAFWGWLIKDKSRVWLDLAYVNCTQTLVGIEIKYQDLPRSQRQVHLYMRGLRRAQPWLYRTFGLALTNDRYCLLRADASGMEESTFCRCSSRGVIAIIQLALGMTLSTKNELGVDPAFELKDKLFLYKGLSPSSEATSSAPTGISTTTMTTMRKRAEFEARPYPNASKYGAGPKVFDAIVSSYWLRYPTAVTLRGPLGEQRFLIDYHLYNSGSLAGRLTRVWCIVADHGMEDETLSGEEAIEGERGSWEQFALRLSWPEVQRAATVEKLMEKIGGDIDNLLLPAKGYEGPWSSQDTFEMRNYGVEDEMWNKRLKELDFENRKQQWSITKLMKPMSQFKDLNEVVDAMIDILDVIERLHKKGIIQRDISDANILIRPGGGGVLADMDMAAEEKIDPVPSYDPYLSDWMSPAAPISAPLGKAFRTGTTPYMACDVLKGETHLVKHDVESVFYVIFLFFFTYSGTSIMQFPDRPIPRFHSWPPAITKWAEGSDLDILASAKSLFFQQPSAIKDTLPHMAPCWKDSHREVARLLSSLHRATLGGLPGSNPEPTPQSLIKALKQWKEDKKKGIF